MNPGLLTASQVDLFSASHQRSKNIHPSTARPENNVWCSYCYLQLVHVLVATATLYMKFGKGLTGCVAVDPGGGGSNNSHGHLDEQNMGSRRALCVHSLQPPCALLEGLEPSWVGG